MKKLSADSPRTKLIAAASAFVWTIAIVTSAGAAQLQEARITQIVNDVKLLLEQAAPRPAVLSDLIRKGAAVRTGTQSRSELTFADLTITRLGANTIFSFKEGTREMNLIDGAILFHVPKGSGGATITTAGVTAGITGTTGIGEFHPATTSHPLFSKWLCLEGKIVLHLPNGQSVELGPGEMVTTDGKSFSQVLTFDIAKLVSTSLFFIGFDRPLPSLDLIMLAAQNQLTSILFPPATPNPLDPIRFANVIDQAMVARQTQTSPAPTPSKFGTPSVITSPVPYLITNGTVITTDPSITTNGVTDFGKIYRGPVDDGAFSLWAFGSTSPLDAVLDATFSADPNHLPLAVFKFQSLSLTGNPTIDLSNGGVTKLGLIGVDGITSGPPGGTLTFTGLDLLVLATVNGSISLTSDVSFQDLNELAMYARGASSNLTINSPISNIGILQLATEGSIHLTNPGTMNVGEFDAFTGGGNLTLQIGGSLLLNGAARLDAMVLPGATVASGANFTLNITGDYTNGSTGGPSFFHITNHGHIGTGGNISVNIGGDLTATAAGTEFPAPGDIQLLVQNTNAQIDNGGNLTLLVGGRINAGTLDARLDNSGGLIGNDTSIAIASGAVTSQGDANFQILNNDGGQIGGNANILVTTRGDITANSILGFVNNRNGGAITSDANILFDIGGTLTTQGDVFFGISTRNDGAGGGTIGSLATVGLDAASVSAGGFFQTFVATNGGGSIQGDAINAAAISGDLRAQQGILVTIEDTIFGGTGNFTGGHIGGNAIVALSAENIITPSTNSGTPGTDLMAIEASIYPNTGGTVGGDAIVGVSASQDISAPGSVLFWVANGNYQNLGPGMIGGNAEVNVTASNISTGDFFDQILNYGGASIGGHAAIDLTASTLSVGGTLDSRIDNFSGGSITASASLTFNLTGNLASQGDANFQILNENGGQIGNSANISVAAGGDLTANSINALINNRNGGSITAGSNLTFNIGGALSTTGDASFVISNRNDGNGGGTIGGDVALTLNAARISAGNLVADVSTNTGGRDRSSAINLNPSGNFVTQGYLDIEVENEGFNVGNVFLHGGIIQTDAVINVSANNISTGTDYFNALVDNEGGGQIGRSATINVAASNAFNIGGNAFFDIINSPNGSGTPAGTIGSNASMTLSAISASIGGLLQMLIDNSGGGSIGGNAAIGVSAANITANSLNVQIDNTGGSIGTGSGGGSAAIGVLTPGTVMADGFTEGIVNNGGLIGGNALSGVEAGSISIAGNSLFQSTISNQGGTITGNAEVGVNPANITANSLLVQIDNSNSGVIGGIARIGINPSGTGTIATDATAQILGSDGAASAEIKIQGNYNVGRTFLSYIDGNGTMTFNNASAHADVLKAGVFGTNGVLRVGGGTLSADSILKLYAPGSNGALNFVSNVTLGGNSLKILAANSVTIFNNIVVTIGGPNPADVYVNFVDGVPNANYTGFGGNGTTTGTFAGAGANRPQPLSNAPPFGTTSPVKLTTGGNITSRTRIPPPARSTITTGGKIADVKRASNVINVRSSDELLSLLDDAAPGPGGKITIPASKSTSNSKNSNRVDPVARLNAASRLNADRRAMDMRTASSSVMRHSPQ